MSVDNSHFHLEKVEDHVDRFIKSLQCASQSLAALCHSLGMEVSKVQEEWRTSYENLLLKFFTTGDIVNRKFVRLDKELERVVNLVGQKIDAKFGEFIADYTEAVEAEER